MGIKVELITSPRHEDAGARDGAYSGVLAGGVLRNEVADSYLQGAPFHTVLKSDDAVSWWRYLPVFGLFAGRRNRISADDKADKGMKDCFRKMEVAKSVPEKVFYAISAVAIHVELAAFKMFSLSASDKDREFNRKIGAMITLMARANDATQVAVDMLEPIVKKEGIANTEAFDIYSFALDTKARVLMFFSNVTGDRFAFDAAVDASKELIKHLLSSENPEDIKLARLYFKRLSPYFNRDFIEEYGPAIKKRSKSLNATGAYSAVSMVSPTLNPIIPKIGLSKRHSILLELKMTIANDFVRSAIEVRNLMAGLDAVKASMRRRVEKK